MRKKNKILLVLGGLNLGITSVGIFQTLSNPLQKTDATAEAQSSTCGFESTESFTAGTTYNSSTAIIGGAEGKQWNIVGGNWSTSSFISGAQSAAMRLYYNSTFYSSLTTKFLTTNMTKVTFSAKAAESSSAKILINVDYSTNGTTWFSMYKVQNSQTDTNKWSASALTTSAATYTAYLPSDSAIYGVTDPYIRISIDSTSKKPTTSNAQLTIDDVAFYGMTDSDSVTLAANSAKIAVGQDQTVNVLSTSGEVVWSCSDESVLTIVGDNTCVMFSGEKEGSATITATVGTATAAVVVTVIAAPVHAGTQADPYSVADAITAIDTNMAVSGSRYYVSGLYVSTTTAWSSQYKNITIVLKDSASASSSLTAYRMAAIVEPTLVANTTTVMLSATTANISLYGTTYEYSNGTYFDPDNAILDSFVAANLHTDIAYTESGTGACKSSGWYTTAKAAFNALTSRQRSLFVADITNYSDAYKRLVAWAVANGESLSSTDNTLGSNPVAFGNTASDDTSNSYVTGFAIIVAALAAGLFLFRKKKQA